GLCFRREQKRNCRGGDRRERKVPVARVEHKSQRRLHRKHGKRDQDNAERKHHHVARAVGGAAEDLGEAPRARSPCQRGRGGGGARRGGAISATAARARERSQSPIVRLSSGPFATVQPISVPDTIAIAASRSHHPMLAAAAARPRTASPVAKTKAASPTPPA